MSELFLLDTHVLIWLVLGDSDRLSPALVERLEEAAARAPLLISAVSAWEVSLAASRGRVTLGMDARQWVQSVFSRPVFEGVALSHTAALESAVLPGELHADPADRFLVATARELQATLVTRDRRLLAYGAQGHLRVLAA